MSFKDETKLLLLIPDMHATVGSCGVADTILIEGSAVKLGLGELGSEGSVLEQFLAGVGWVPELDRSRGDSDKFQIVWLLGPLDVVDGV